MVRAHTTVGAHSAQQGNMKSMGEGSASTRQETPSKCSNDSSRVVKTPKGDEDRYTYEELMEMCANIVKDMENQTQSKPVEAVEMGFKEEDVRIEGEFERDYHHGIRKMTRMTDAKLFANGVSELAKDLTKKILKR